MHVILVLKDSLFYVLRNGRMYWQLQSTCYIATCPSSEIQYPDGLSMGRDTSPRAAEGIWINHNLHVVVVRTDVDPITTSAISGFYCTTSYHNCGVENHRHVLCDLWEFLLFSTHAIKYVPHFCQCSVIHVSLLLQGMHLACYIPFQSTYMYSELSFDTQNYMHGR